MSVIKSQFSVLYYVVNGRYCWARICLRRGVPAQLQDRNAKGKKMSEVSDCQGSWRWWDLRKAVDKGLEVPGSPKKLMRDSMQAHL